MMRKLVFSMLILGISSSGCPAREVSEVPPRQQKEEYIDIPVDVNRDLDLLFVIDNSGSMQEEQEALVSNFPKFINVLNGIQGGLPNVHIGVVSSDLGVGSQPDGTVGGCSESGGDRGAFHARKMDGTWCLDQGKYFIVDEEQVPCEDETSDCRIRNYSVDDEKGVGLDEAFACIAGLGTKGCGLEQHLEAMEKALNNSNPENANFLRPKAFLAIVIIADEDDCSAKDTAIFTPKDDNAKSKIGPMSFRCTEYGVMCDGANVDRQAAVYGECEARGDSYLFHPEKYLKFLQGLKKDDWQQKLVIAGIIGPVKPFEVRLKGDTPELAPSCGEGGLSRPQPAVPGVRIKWLIDQFNPPYVSEKNGSYEEICAEDLSGALNRIAEILIRKINNPCIAGVISTDDVDPAEPGLQIECQVSDMSPKNGEETIRRCNMDPLKPTEPAKDNDLPCWYAYQDEDRCEKYSSKLAIQVKRATVSTETGLRVVARCALVR
ncbi:MAG: vWA domain-containing protein [Pseudomonadota bacterium]